MRTQLSDKLEAGRLVIGPLRSDRGSAFGMFHVQGPCGALLRIVASGYKPELEDECQGWEHVSVSTPHRCPYWPEMCFIKDLFWEPDECVAQFHPPESEYVNNHPYCLHMWRNVHMAFAMPPSHMVGVKREGIVTQERAQELVLKQLSSHPYPFASGGRLK